MSRVIVVLATFLVLSMTAVGSASAAWTAEGLELSATSKAALATTAKVDTAYLLSIPAVKTSLTCNGTTLKNESAEIIEVNKLKAKSLTFEDCETTQPKAGCSLESQPSSIKTNPLSGLATNVTKSFEDRLTLSAQTKNVLAEIHFSAENECALAGAEPLRGQVTVKAPTLQEEAAEQAFEGLGSTENNSLEIGTGKAYLEHGKALLKLASGGAWQTGAPAHWYNNNALATQSTEATGLAVSTGSGTETVALEEVTAKKTAICKMSDSGKIWNPTPTAERRGLGSITAVTFTGCSLTGCATNPGLEAVRLPWSVGLLAGNPIRLEAPGMALRTTCNGVNGPILDNQITVPAKIFNGSGSGEASCSASEHTTWVEFADIFAGIEEIGSFSARDCIWGTAANEKITVKAP
jgi:hypothetical protein